MPDLDVIYVQVCTNDAVSDDFVSSKGTDVYHATASHNEELCNCTCPGWIYRRKCRHVTELQGRLCSWNEQIDDERQTPQQEMEGVCPKCGSETRVIRWGV